MGYSDVAVSQKGDTLQEEDETRGSPAELGRGPRGRTALPGYIRLRIIRVYSSKFLLCANKELNSD